MSYPQSSPIPPYTPPQAHTGPVLQGTVVGGPGYQAPCTAPVAVRQKSLLLAALLAGFFPPIGMLYGTIFGTLVMTILGLPIVLVTGGAAAPYLWPVAVVWAVWGAHRTNQRRLALASLFGR